MESTDSSSASHHPPLLPPGFRFHPTDEELVVHYLKNKASSAPLPITIIAEVDLYKFDPWELPGTLHIFIDLYMLHIFINSFSSVHTTEKANFGEQEWYFFSPRDRKYPNGARPNRAATSGYWKATGTDKPILSCGGTQKVGVKKALVFYGGKPPKGIKTNWIMHEYRLAESSSASSVAKKASLRLDDWVLCRIYKKNNSNHRFSERENFGSPAHHHSPNLQLQTVRTSYSAANYTALLDSADETFFEGLLASEDCQTQACREKSLISHSAKQPTHWRQVVENNTILSSAKRFRASSNNGSGGGPAPSILNLLNLQMPQQLHQETQLGDGGVASLFRQPFTLSDINWSS